MSANSQLGTCVLEVALCLLQQLLDSSTESSSYAVGESVMARRMDGDFGEGTVLDQLDDGARTAAPGAQLLPCGLLRMGIAPMPVSAAQPL